MGDRALRVVSSVGGSFLRSLKSSASSKQTSEQADSAPDNSSQASRGEADGAPTEVTGSSSVEASRGSEGSDEHLRSVTVGKVTPQDREEWDGNDGADESYRYADCIVQDVVLLGTPVGTDVSPPMERKAMPCCYMP